MFLSATNRQSSGTDFSLDRTVRNDAAVTLAEGMAGSEQAFAEMMNAEAKRLGMNNTHFENSTACPRQTPDCARFGGVVGRHHPRLS